MVSLGRGGARMKKPRPSPAGFSGSSFASGSARTISRHPALRSAGRRENDPEAAAHAVNIAVGRAHVKLREASAPTILAVPVSLGECSGGGDLVWRSGGGAG